MFAYCKNNPVNGKDPSGFRPIYTMDEETDSMRETSISVMYVANIDKKSYSNRNTQNGVGDVIRSYVAGAVSSISEETASDAVIGYAHTKWTGPLPMKLGDFDSFGKYFKVLGALSFCWSVQDNFSGQYSNLEAILRTVIDIGVFAAGLTVFAGGGWAAVGGGLAVAAGAEGFKWLMNIGFNNSPALKPKY